MTAPRPTRPAAPRWAGGRPSTGFPDGVRSLPLDEWPEGDRRAWEAACRAGGPFDAAGAAVHLAPASREKRVKAYGAVLSWLKSQGELDPHGAVADRLTPERIGRYIAHMRQRLRASSLHHQLVELSYALAAMAPDRDWAWIRRHPARPTAAEIRASRKPIAPPPPEALLGGGFTLCDTAKGIAHPLKAALTYRDGVLLAVATCFTLRRRNLAEIDIGVHLQISAEGAMRLTLDTKNGEVIDTPLPAWLADLVATYLATHRKVLLGSRPDHHALWVNQWGERLAATALRGVFQRLGKRTVGRPITVHVTRHALATTIMTRDPRDLEVASAALAHRGTTSVNRVYDRSGAEMADAAWKKLLRRRKKKGPAL